MKIKVTPTGPKTKQYNDFDHLPDGLYIDADGDYVFNHKHLGDYLVFDGKTGNVMPGEIAWPLTPASAGTKIEIVA